MVLKDNVIVGMILINDIEKAGILFHLMKSGVKVKKFKRELLSEDFCLATLPRSLRRKIYPGEFK
jgi:NAD(P)H-nitrite reductase large subunit